MMLWRLFVGFLQVGLFTFGGGYASLPLVQEQAVGGGWLDMREFADMLAISQMTPGPIAINLATFVGLRSAGVAGAVVATCAYMLPSFVAVSALAWLYGRYRQAQALQDALMGLRPAAVGLILSAGVSVVALSLFGSEMAAAFAGMRPNAVALALVLASFAALRVFKAPQAAVIAGCGALGGLAHMFGLADWFAN